MKNAMPWKLFLVQFIRLFNLILLQNHGPSSCFLIAASAIVTFCDNVARLIGEGERCVRCFKFKSWTSWSEECRLSLWMCNTSKKWIFMSGFWQWTFYKEWKLTHGHSRTRRLDSRSRLRLVLMWCKTRLWLRNRWYPRFLYQATLCIQINNIHNKMKSN